MSECYPGEFPCTYSEETAATAVVAVTMGGDCEATAVTLRFKYGLKAEISAASTVPA